MNWKSILAIAAIIFTTTLWAQTPDGETPADEGVCDGLVDYTPGLFGLCNAYCEAQDCDAIGGDTKSCTKILDNYNDTMVEGVDPAMPCLVSEPVSCPCFTFEEARLSYDGMYSWFDRTSLLFEGWFIGSICLLEDLPLDSEFLAGFSYGIGGPDWPLSYGYIEDTMVVQWSPDEAFCVHVKNSDSTFITWITEDLSSIPRSESYEELRACFDILNAVIPEDQSLCNFGM